MSTMIVILKGATSANFPLVAEKRKLIRVSATVTAIVIQDDAPLESLLASAKHLPNMVKIAFETMIARLNIVCFPLALTIVMVHIA